MGGVITPSARRVAAPIIAGTVSHFACLLTRAKSAKIPPSPRLSARRIKITYFNVVCKVSVQKIHESPPKTVRSSMASVPTMDWQRHVVRESGSQVFLLPRGLWEEIKLQLLCSCTHGVNVSGELWFTCGLIDFPSIRRTQCKRRLHFA